VADGSASTAIGAEPGILERALAVLTPKETGKTAAA
jgi:hypothetical protein